MSYKVNIENKTLDNTYYRNVLYTTENIQLVLMNLRPKQEIGNEKHDGSQFIRVESGSGTAIVAGKKYYLADGSVLIINQETYHNIIAGKNGMKLYAIYSPPQHDPNAKQKEKL